MAEKVKIVIEVDSKTGVANMKQFGTSSDRVTSGMKRQEKAAKSLTGSLTGVVAALGGFVAIRSITGWMGEWVEAAGKQQQSVAGMEQAMRSMGRYTPQLRDELIGLAQGFQRVTTFGDEATIEGTKFLLTYKDITDKLLPRSIKTMLDLAALMGGDTRQAANMLGKASMGLAGELRRVGITIDETIGKSGDFSAILREIEKQVGGQAEALARTGYGGLQQLRNLAGDTKEQFGELLLKVGQAGVFDTLKTMLMGVTDKMSLWIEQNDTLINQKVKEYVDGITVSLKGIVGVYNSLPEGVIGAAGMGIVGRIISGSTPIGVLTGAVVLLNTQLKTLGMNLWALPQKYKELSEYTQKIWDALTGKKDWRTGADLTTGGITDSWMGRPLSKATGPAKPDTGGSTQDLWKSFGGGEAESFSNWVQSAYGFSQPEEWLQPQLGLVEDMTAEHFRRMKELTAGNKMEIAEILRSNTANELKIEQDMQMKRLDIYQSVAAGISNTFLQISQAGGKQSKEAFKLYQAFAIVEAGISTAMSIIKTLAEPALPWPSNVIMAGIIGGMGLLQVGMIASAKPPSYDQGGISTTPGMYYAGVPEAHVPLKSGAIPVAFNAGRGGGDIFIVMENPVFQDLETQQAVFANIAANITERIAPNAVVRAYDNDHAIRGRIRGRA